MSRCGWLAGYASGRGERIQISYTDSGGQGPAVVFSHGYLLYYTKFGRQVAALAAGAFTYWDSAADLLGLLDQLGVGRAVLAGMSQDGFVSLRAALTAPDRVRALVLIDREGGLGTGPPRRGMSSCTGPGRGTGPGRCSKWSPRSSWARAGGTAGTPGGTSSRRGGRRMIWGSWPGRSVPVPDGQG